MIQLGLLELEQHQQTQHQTERMNHSQKTQEDDSSIELEGPELEVAI